MWLGWPLAAIVLACRHLGRRGRDVSGPAPGRTHEQLRHAAREGDLWAAFALARRRHVRSVTELVMLVYPGRPPTASEADVVLDGWALACELRRDQDLRARSRA